MPRIEAMLKIKCQKDGSTINIGDCTDCKSFKDFLFQGGRIHGVDCNYSPGPSLEINPHLSLKLEDGKTNIYVNNQLFSQCKSLLLNIPQEEVSRYDGINSIDEVMDLGFYEQPHSKISTMIKPEVEFWGHCSNLQAWYEHDYDTRLLHAKLAFPLLKSLTEAGDPKARRAFTEEIAVRISEGYLPVILYLIKQRYHEFFTLDELTALDLSRFPPLARMIMKLIILMKTDSRFKIEFWSSSHVAIYRWENGSGTPIAMLETNIIYKGKIRTHARTTHELVDTPIWEHESHPLEHLNEMKTIAYENTIYYNFNHESHLDFLMFPKERVDRMLDLLNNKEDYFLFIPLKLNYYQGIKFINFKDNIAIAVFSSNIRKQYFKKYLQKKEKLLKRAARLCKKYNLNLSQNHDTPGIRR